MNYDWKTKWLALAMGAALVAGCSGDPEPSDEQDGDTGADVELDSDPEPDVEQDAGDDADEDVEGDADNDVEDDAGDDPFEGLSDGEVMTQMLASGVCAAAWDCSGDSQTATLLSNQLSRYGSEEACVAGGSEWLVLFEFDNLIAAVDEGRILLDREGVDVCMQALTDFFCNTSGLSGADGPPPECEAILEGTRNEGEPCLETDECSADLECSHEDSGEACFGTCVDPAVARACGDSVCSSWEACDDSGTEPVCDPIPGAGDECTELGDECAEGEFCEFGYCEGPQPFEFELIPEGQPCEPGPMGLCEPGLLCQQPLDDQGEIDDEATPRCGSPRQLDEGCSASEECLFGLVCAEGAHCEPVLEVGSFCQTSADCRSLSCDSLEGVCVELDTCEVPEP